MGLDSVAWVLELQDEFGVTIPDEVVGTMRSPRAAVEYIVPRVDPLVWPRERIEARVLEISAEQFGRPLGEIRLDSDIVDDLGAD